MLLIFHFLIIGNILFRFKLTDAGRESALQLKSDSVTFPVNESDEPVLSLESASELIAPHKPRGRQIKKVYIFNLYVF